MPAVLKHPGIYIEEIPSGVRTIVGVSTSVTAFIGRARKGPENEPTVINSYADYERTFGGLWLDSNMSFAVRDFFLNGGGQAVIIRLHEPTPAAAGGGGAAPIPAAREIAVGRWPFVAASAGSWAGALRITVEAASSAGSAHLVEQYAQSIGLTPSDLFNVRVEEKAPGGRVEQFQNVSVKKGPRRIDKVLLAESDLIRWRSLDSSSWQNADANLSPFPAPAGPPAADPPEPPAGQPPAGPPAAAPPAAPSAAPTTASDAIGALEASLDTKEKEKKTLRTAPPGETAADKATREGKLATLDGEITQIKTQIKTALDALDDGVALTKSSLLPQNGQAEKKGLHALERLFAKGLLFNLLCIPPYTTGGGVDPEVIDTAAAYCETRRAVLIVDPPPSWSSKDDARDNFTAQADFSTNSRNAAVFFPRLRQSNPLRDDQIEDFAPCGAVAGIMARTDAQRGVWKAPAGLDASIVGARALAVPLSDDENGELNPLGINCLRTFPIYGRVVWGARTLRGADQLADEYKFLPVRRTALFIEESLYQGLKWVVFEPNDEPLWASIRLNVGAFMNGLFRQGAFQGASPRDAYFVQCDKSTTIQSDVNRGIVNVHVGFAALKPAEFVVLKIQQMAGQIDV